MSRSGLTLSLALLAGVAVILSACNAPAGPAAPTSTAPTPTPTQEVERIQLDPCTLLTEAEVAAVLGGAVQMQPALGTGGCSYMFTSPDATTTAQLTLSVAQGEEAKSLSMIGITLLVGFSGDPGMNERFVALSDQVPELSLEELVDQVGSIFQGTGVSATMDSLSAGGSSLWLLSESEAYSQGTLILVRGDEYVSLTLIGPDAAAAPGPLTHLGETVFERLPPAFYVLDETGSGTFSFELGSGDETAASSTPVEIQAPTPEAAGLVWVTAPNAGVVHAIDPMSNAVVATVSLGRFPSDIAVAGGRVWVVSDTEGIVWRIDPETYEVVQTLQLNGNATNIDADADQLWIAGGLGVSMFDLITDTRYDVVDSPAYDVVIGEDAVWASQTQDMQLLRIDPQARRVVATVRLPGQPTWIAYGHGFLWAVLSDRDELVAVDPSSGEVVNSFPYRYVIHGLAVGPSRLWYSTPLALYCIEAGTWEARTISPTGHPIRIAYYAGSLWTTGGDEGVVTRYDPEDGRALAAIDLGNDPTGIAAGE